MSEESDRKVGVSGGVSLSGGGIGVTLSGGGGGVSIGGGSGISLSSGGSAGGYGSGSAVSGSSVSMSGGYSISGGSGYGGAIDGSGSGSGSGSMRSSYKPISQSRGSFKDYQKKVSGSGAGSGGVATQISIQSNPGFALLSQTSMHSGVDTLKKGRTQEKKDLQELNERFASYIEKARFLEAQNKNLVAEIEILKGGSTNDNSKIKEMYEVELNQLRKLLNESEKARAPLELKVHSLETELDDILIRFRVLENQNLEYRTTTERQRKEIMGLESELVQLRRSKSSYDEDSVKYKDEINYMKEDLKKVRADYDREALARINLEHDLQALQETMEFERQVNETELKNLSGVAFRDTTKENQVFWQNEMGRALRDIAAEYENKMVVMKQELEANYGLQLQDVRTSKTRENVETSHLREENTRTKTTIQGMKSRMTELEKKVSEYEILLGQLRGELDESQRESELTRMLLQEELTTTQSHLTQTLVELQSILDAKLGLELEICAYRKLLEFEETRVNASTDGDATMSQFISLAGGGGSYGGSGSYGGGSSSGGGITMSGGSSSGGGITMSGGSSSGGIGLSFGGGSAGGIGLSLGGGSAGGVALSVGGGVSVGGGSSSTERTETESQRIKFRKTTKGNISISEIDIQGNFVLLENIGTSVEQLGGMVIKRNIDGVEDKVVYYIPANVSLKATQKLRICANGKKTGKGKELEIDEASWGVGDDIKTILYDTEGEPKAQHIQELVR